MIKKRVNEKKKIQGKNVMGSDDKSGTWLAGKELRGKGVGHGKYQNSCYGDEDLHTTHTSHAPVEQIAIFFSSSRITERRSTLLTDPHQNQNNFLLKSLKDCQFTEESCSRSSDSFDGMI